MKNRRTYLIERGQKLERPTTIVQHLYKKSETITVYMVRSAFIPFHEKDEDILKIVNCCKLATSLHLAVTIASLRKSEKQLKETSKTYKKIFYNLSLRMKTPTELAHLDSAPGFLRESIL